MYTVSWLRSIISEARRASAACYHRALDETKRIPDRTGARPTLSLPRLGRGKRAEALHAARLDGRVGLVPVPGGFDARRLAGDRARLARFRAHRLEPKRQLLVSGLFRRSRRAPRAFPARRAGYARRAQHG